MKDSDRVAVVRAFMAAFLEQYRVAAESLMADDFRLTSPQDDHIDRAAWLERCFPSWTHFDELPDTLQITEIDGVVIHRYEYRVGGVRWRNVEALDVVDGRVREVEVYFGGAVEALSARL